MSQFFTSVFQSVGVSASVSVLPVNIQDWFLLGWTGWIFCNPRDSQVWNRSPVQVGCMRQVHGAGALGWPRGMGWGGRWEGGSVWGTHVNPWLIQVNLWKNPLQYCKIIILQLIKINERKKESSPIPQFKSINSLALSFLYSLTFTVIHDYWKNHNLD